MISFKEAYQKVLEHSLDLGNEKVPLLESTGRILAEPILADRDFPPFDRATKDGIAIQWNTAVAPNHEFKIEGVASAGMPQQELKDIQACLEVMTGAVVPKSADSVVMYEHLTITNGYAIINKEISQGQNIHYQGSDEKKGAILIEKGKSISPAEIGVMATVGKSEILVKRLPKVCTIATGNELVTIAETPEPHQIRKSNTITLESALSCFGISATSLHLADDKVTIAHALKIALKDNDVLLLSGGVSKGKFDFIPEVMESLGVQKVFHRVAQRPGKPFWFGIHKELKTVIFSFPGNPVSTFANYHLYFLPWLYTTWGIPLEEQYVKLTGQIQIHPPLTRFIQVKTHFKDGILFATPITENGSGDLVSLVQSDGFICLEPRNEPYREGELVRYVGTR